MSAENILLSPKQGQIGTLRDPKHEVLGNEVPHGPSLTIREDYRKKNRIEASENNFNR